MNAETKVSFSSSPCPLGYFPGLCQLLMIKKNHIIWSFCVHCSMMFRPLESTSLEGWTPRANVFPHCPCYFVVFLGISYAFCVCYMVFSLHSIYFFVIQLLLRMIYWKKKERNQHYGLILPCPHKEWLSI